MHSQCKKILNRYLIIFHYALQVTPNDRTALVNVQSLITQKIVSGEPQTSQLRNL